MSRLRDDSDEEFISQAKASWARVLEMGDGKQTDSCALAAALWASLHVDRLIAIAEGKAAPELLEAARWALNELNGRNRYDEDVADQQVEHCYRRAEDAIRKAMGEAA